MFLLINMYARSGRKVLRAKFLHCKYLIYGNPFFLYSSKASTRRTLLTKGYIGAHSRAPDKHTLNGPAQKKAFEFANALANIFT